jgi:hypothetical protein
MSSTFIPKGDLTYRSIGLAKHGSEGGEETSGPLLGEWGMTAEGMPP